MSKWRRSPRRVSFVVDRLRDELAPQTLLAEVQRAWPTAVGSAVADHAQPTGERGGVLTVSCAASVWAQELDLLAPVILDRLNEVLGAGRLSRLRCVAVPPQNQKSR